MLSTHSKEYEYNNKFNNVLKKSNLNFKFCNYLKIDQMVVKVKIITELE